MEYFNKIQGVNMVDNIPSDMVHEVTLVNEGNMDNLSKFPQVKSKIESIIERGLNDINNCLYKVKIIAKYKSEIFFVVCLLFSAIFEVNSFIERKAEMNRVQLEMEYNKQLIKQYEEYSKYASGSEIVYDVLACHPHLPDYFNYIDVNSDKLKEYLSSRNSLLSEEPYFSSIIRTSKEFNLNPLILFAITGQEQGFVPKSQKYASKIANNPFNVFVSWRKYNTDIKDSSEIAARTVINLGKGKPENIDQFKWINRLYASDPNWYKGVRSLFNKLSEVCNVEY